MISTFKYIFLIFNILNAQGYTLEDCIRISIDEKKSISNLINLIKKRDKLKLDDNYYFTPIYTYTLIYILKKLLKKKSKGIFNLVGNERISKYQFGLLIADILKINKPNIFKDSIENAKLKAIRCIDLSLSN